MRLGWTRTLPELTPEHNDVRAMVRARFPEAVVLGFESVSGGLANTNLRVDLEGAPHRVLLRLYQRDARQAAKEAALAERLPPFVPRPRYLHIGRHKGFRFALVEWAEGTRLEMQLTGSDDDTRRRAGVDVGRVLGSIHSRTYAQIGFLDENLEVAVPVEGGPAFFLDFLRASFIDGKGFDRLGADLARAAMRYAEAHADLKWPGPPCLIHSDFNGSNILMSSPIGISAVLDWEFAMSATPDADFGNLLRNHPDEAFLDGVVAGYRSVGGAVPKNWRTLARNSDLMAWADMLSRHGLHSSVIESAKRAIEETVGS